MLKTVPAPDQWPFPTNRSSRWPAHHNPRTRPTHTPGQNDKRKHANGRPLQIRTEEDTEITARDSGVPHTYH